MSVTLVTQGTRQQMCSSHSVAEIYSLIWLCFFQIIQLLSVVDPDDPVEGHHFYFSMVPEKHINPNFTIRDNQGQIIRHIKYIYWLLDPIHDFFFMEPNHNNIN